MVHLMWRTTSTMTASAVFAALLSPLPSPAGPGLLRNMPGVCAQPSRECDCQTKKVSANCIKAEIGLGETTPWTGSRSCALKVFADDDSPSVFTVESLYAVLGGYTFKRLGQRNMSDGVTPAEVVFSHPRGEPVSFVFSDGESVARPDPGVHIRMDERLMRHAPPVPRDERDGRAGQAGVGHGREGRHGDARRYGRRYRL